MSADSRPDPGTDGLPAAACSLCDAPLKGAWLAIQCYPPTGEAPPAVAASDGLVGVCPDCAGDVNDLLAVWRGHDAPPVGPDRPIHEGFGRVADACSFCDDDLGDPGLGVEYVPRPGDGARADGYANYSLCDGCTGVFAEFLAGVREDATA